MSWTRLNATCTHQFGWSRPCTSPLSRRTFPLRVVPQATSSREEVKGNGPLYLSDIIAFESETSKDPQQRADDIFRRAETVLEAVNQALDVAPPPGNAAQGSGNTPPTGAPAAIPPLVPIPVSTRRAELVARPWGPSGPPGSPGGGFTMPAIDDDDLTRKVLSSSLGAKKPGGSSSSNGAGAAASAAASAAPDGSKGSAFSLPGWASSLSAGSSGRQGPPTPTPQLAKAPSPTPRLSAMFKEPDFLPAALALSSQAEEDARRARVAVLPPLQSIMELTSAFRPPTRSDVEASSGAPVDASTEEQLEQHTRVMQMEDGAGVLADGTKWEKMTGEDVGENGFWSRWCVIKGSTPDGVEWEEKWWENSDWTGMKELGAAKSGGTAQGAAWKESWSEKVCTGSMLEMVIERQCHKWAHAEDGDEWEEKWGENYTAVGRVAKYADKWAKQGPNVWHERWGEDYDGKGACTKWTDKWAERLLSDGRKEQWGDKWREAFGSGSGAKNGEVWSLGPDGEWYHRHWGEDHYGNGRVRKHGHSNTGERWDAVESMDTYYNPVPHFGFRHAVDHSKELWRVPERPRPTDDEFGGLGPGISDL